MKPPDTFLLPGIAGASCLLLLAACGGGGAGREAPGGNSRAPAPEPEPPPPEFVVRGELFSFDTGMIANADINIWVQAPGLGYSYGRANGQLRSDGLGLFEAQVPESDILLLADSDDYVQPCAVRTDVTQDVEVRIEMLPKSALAVTNPPRPQLSVEPSITGTIVETTSNGRRAVPGASLTAQDAQETGLATTRSDAGGGFYLCNLPEETYIDVRKVGFNPVLVGPIGGAEPAVLEIELVRESCPYC
jgi:hypothetical protein